MLDLGAAFQVCFHGSSWWMSSPGGTAFHHWELVFADVFHGRRADGSVRSGFDLIVGNPPWVKVAWDEKGVLGEFDPVIAVKKFPAPRVSGMVEGFVSDNACCTRRVVRPDGGRPRPRRSFSMRRKTTLCSEGQQTNLYKCFLPQAWMIASQRGVVGLLHPEGVYDDPKAGILRAALYRRLRRHFQFLNEPADAVSGGASP